MYQVTGVLLAASAALAFIRLVRGPSALDRALALDVVMVVMMSAVAAEAAFNRHQSSLAILAALAVVGFVASVAVARFAARREASAQTPQGEAASGQRETPSDGNEG